MTSRVGAWLLGGWLAAAAVWPVLRIQISKSGILCQPLLWASLLVLALVQRRRVGWAAAIGQGLYLYIPFTLAGWLPWLWSTASAWSELPYPRVYDGYLYTYQAALAALVGFQAWVAGSGRGPAWWPMGAWSRPLVAAPALLMVRAMLAGHWIAPLVGLIVGLGAGRLVPWGRGDGRASARWWSAVPWLLLATATLLAFGSGLRILGQTGAVFPDASDDGSLYYGSALLVAEDPAWFWTSPEADRNFVSFYYYMMGLWFRLIGHPHMPSWLAWQGVAAGLLAVAVYWIGARMGSRLVGLAAGGLVAADHVMLHLMGTLNMEVFSIPTLYVGLWLWADAQDLPEPRRRSRCVAAGIMLGVSTLFRPTAGLLPGLLLAALALERPRLSWGQIRAQASRFIAGFALPMFVMLVRNRSLWGHWTVVGQTQGSHLSWRANYAWRVQGQHPADIGMGPWLQLVAEDPAVIWREMIPKWWDQMLLLWTHPGFGQMDLIQGLNHRGPYQTALIAIFTAAVVAGVVCALRRRSRADLALLALPAYYTGLVLVYYVINTRYRSPFIPALYLLACLGVHWAVTAIRAVRPALATAPPVQAGADAEVVAVEPAR